MNLTVTISKNAEQLTFSLNELKILYELLDDLFDPVRHASRDKQIKEMYAESYGRETGT